MTIRWSSPRMAARSAAAIRPRCPTARRTRTGSPRSPTSSSRACATPPLASPSPTWKRPRPPSRGGGAPRLLGGSGRIRAVTTPLPAAAVSVPSALVVLPAPPGKGLPPDTVIAGLPLLLRIVLAAARAGFERILVHPGACPEPRLLEGTGAAVLDGRAGTPAPERLVLLPVNVLPQARWLRGLREMPLEPET